jgi:hypothetical protein
VDYGALAQCGVPALTGGGSSALRSVDPAVAEPFIRTVALKRDEVSDFQAYPFSIPAIASLERRYEETEQYELTRSFLDDRERFLHYLFTDDDA